MWGRASHAWSPLARANNSHTVGFNRLLGLDIDLLLRFELLGRRYPVPVLLAPIGVLSIVHPDAELAVARAARAVGVPMILSTAASRPLEAVAQATTQGYLFVFNRLTGTPLFPVSEVPVEQRRASLIA